MNNKKWSELNGHPLSTFLTGEDKYIFSFFLFFVFPSIFFFTAFTREKDKGKMKKHRALVKKL